MARTSALVFAGIAPHPPIMVPEVGREAAGEVRSSIDAMAALTARIVDAGAETVIIISPHAPLDPAAFIAYGGPQLHGDFANFRSATTTVEAEIDEELLHEISRIAAEKELQLLRIHGHDLDHGTTVPLYFLQRNGWHGRVIALGYSFVSNEDHVRFGECIRQAIEKVGRPVAFIASGDLSHRLKVNAPAGYNPIAHFFDEEVVDAIRTSSTGRIVNIDQELRRIAGECGYRSMLVAIGVAGGGERNCEVLNYEAPFGVGYLVAQLVAERAATASGSAPSASADLTTKGGFALAITALARQTIEAFITTGTVISPPDDLPEEFTAHAGCFVSIKTHEGELRGCVGTIEPAKETLAEELIWNAISAATRDPRFAPVRSDELARLKYSVDVLSTPEPATLDDLEPAVYGLIVEDEAGLRRGLLLPNLAGVDSASKQLEIASRKAGIAPDTPVKLFRFRADRYSE
jgi:AmmeMemoRadiSam system protein A/AmmeMemoRadiSam system protein B